MDSLKALRNKLKEETKEVSSGKRYFCRADLEARRLEKLREEEARENELKKRKLSVEVYFADPSQGASDSKELAPVSIESVKELEPVTKVLEPLEKDVNVAPPVSKASQPPPLEEELDPLALAFKKAAVQVAEQRKEEELTTPQRIAYYLKKWSKEWEAELDRRTPEEKSSGPGTQATRIFKQTMKHLQPLYDRLKQDALPDDLKTGLWDMVYAMKTRNYLHANDIYLRLAIGNAPWPIGVTSVGIHERSAREKISHVMNVQGQAHIMNDEATRKYFQAVKRMVTQLQRLYPTDPSKSADYDARFSAKAIQGSEVLRICSSS